MKTKFRFYICLWLSFIQAKETNALIGIYLEKLGLILKDRAYTSFEDINVCKTTKGNHKSEPKEW